MSLTRRILAPREERGLTASEALRRLSQSTVTRSGAMVNEHTAMQLMAVYTAVRILAESLAQVPLKVYRRADDGTRTEARDHPVFKILHDQPNNEMTAFTLWEAAMAHLALWGNAYCEISRNFNGDVIGLWPLRPDRTRPIRSKTGALVYETRIQKDPGGLPSETVYLEARNVLHIPGLGFDGLKGMSVIGTVREGIGLAFAYEAFGSYFFGNNTVPGLTLATDQPLKKQQVDEIEQHIKEGHEGLSNSQRLMILTSGLKPVDTGMPLNDAQFLEQRRYTRSEIMGLYRIAPHLSNDTEKVSSWGAGIEQMSLAHMKFTMVPYFRRFEQAINMKLLGANAQSQLFPEFDPDGFLRGDFKTRMEGYAIGRQWGWTSVNDIKRRENEPTIGPQGDIYLTPSNMVPSDRLDDIVDKQVEPSQPPIIQPARAMETRPIGPYEDWDACVADQISKGHDKDSAEKICGSLEADANAVRWWRVRAFHPALVDATERILRREQNDVASGIRRLLKKDALAEIPAWIEEFYAEHRRWAAKQAAPVFAGIAETLGVRDGHTVRAALGAYVEHLCAGSMEGLHRAIRGEDDIETVLGSFGRSANDIAERELRIALDLMTEGGEDVDYMKVQKMLETHGDALLQKMRGLIPGPQASPTINATLVMPDGAFAPVINVEAAAPPNITVAPPNITVAPPNITVAPPNITVAPPNITVAPLEVKFPKESITVNVESPSEEVEFKRNRDGVITGMKRKKEED